MATRADVDAYRRSQADVVTLARRELVAWWSTLDVSDADAVARALEVFLPELVAAYGDVASTVAADWYDDLRAQAPAHGGYRATLADPLPVEQVRATARWGAGPLFSVAPDPDKALSLIGGAIQRYVQQGGRDTLARNASRDPARPRWARVPSGVETCAFCLMLASRGFAYHTRQSAGEMTQFHDLCDCQIVPDWSPTPALDGYDPDRLYEQYLAARAEAGGSTKAILAQLREDLGVS